MTLSIADLIKQGPVVTDGAWGTQLQSLGLPIGELPDAWNLAFPDRVEQVARAYNEAGSQVVLTNTFGATRINLEKYGGPDQVREINRAGAAISKRAGNALVFASIGPCGKMLMTGEVSEDAVLAAFQEQAEALAEGGADALVVETMSDPREAALAVRAAKTTGLPVVGCMVFDSGKNKDRTMMGTTPEQAVAALTDAGADVIGTNCGQGIAGFLPICERYRKATTLPLWIKANAGLPEVVNGKVTYAMTPDEFASHVPALIQAGANFIGGCCGTRPDFIRAVRNTLA